MSLWPLSTSTLTQVKTAFAVFSPHVRVRRERSATQVFVLASFSSERTCKVTTADRLRLPTRTRRLAAAATAAFPRPPNSKAPTVSREQVVAMEGLRLRVPAPISLRTRPISSRMAVLPLRALQRLTAAGRISLAALLVAVPSMAMAAVLASTAACEAALVGPTEVLSPFST